MISCYQSNPITSEEYRTIEGVSVTISTPDGEVTPSGVTFLLPGAMISISEYASTIDVLLSRGQFVLSLFINVIVPFKDNHRAHARKIRTIFDTFHREHPYLPNRYNIVGHSVGGKIALLVAALYDTDRVDKVIALDPVDQKPPEFTNTGDDGNNLKIPTVAQSHHRTILMTLTDGGRGISKDHNADAIHVLNSTTTTLVRHVGAGHMAYTDHGGGMPGLMMPGGTEQSNRSAREGAHNLIRAIIGTSSSLAASSLNNSFSLIPDDNFNSAGNNEIIVCLPVPLLASEGISS